MAAIVRVVLGLVVAGACLLSQARSEESGWRVGLASVRITPAGPIAMGGYGPRISQGVLDDLCAKALAIQWGDDEPAVLVTMDLLFLRAPVAEAFSAKIVAATGLKRRQLLLNMSHTHSGPLVGLTADLDSFGVPTDQRAAVAAYTETLQKQLVQLVAAALADKRPARLSWAAGQAGFAVNRRLKTASGVVMAPNPQGCTDRSVRVLRVDDGQGRLRAVVFGYACHPVTLDGSNRKISGDYVSFAQRQVEQQQPGVQAMFLAGCGANANTHPRGGKDQEQLVRRHGENLAAETCRVLAGATTAVRGPLRVAMAWTGLPLEHNYSLAQLRELAAKAPSVWHRRNAQALLQRRERGQPLPESYRAPFAFWQFGSDLSLVGLPGEAVAEYVGLIQDALGSENLWVAAYCGESFGYLPTAAMLREGGHESMCLTLDSGIFSADIESSVVAAVRQLAAQAGRSRP